VKLLVLGGLTNAHRSVIRIKTGNTTIYVFTLVQRLNVVLAHLEQLEPLRLPWGGPLFEPLRMRWVFDMLSQQWPIILNEVGISRELWFLLVESLLNLGL